jgi:hypothetical protein
MPQARPLLAWVAWSATRGVEGVDQAIAIVVLTILTSEALRVLLSLTIYPLTARIARVVDEPIAIIIHTI